MNFLEISLVFFYNDNNPQRFFQECWKQNRRGSMEQRYSVTQAAQILGVRASVLRYWEDELNLRISRNEQGHRYYTGYDITLLANIKELKKRGLALRAIKEVIPKISQTPPGSTDHKVKLLNDEQEEWQLRNESGNAMRNSGENIRKNAGRNGTGQDMEKEKILEFQNILERLITQELQMKKEGENDCRSLDAAIRSRQLARKEAAASLEKKNKKRRRKY